MANKAKAKGTAWETAVVNYLNEGDVGPLARRLPLSGNVDKGDIEYLLGGGLTITIQAKAQKAYDLSGWLAGAHDQMRAAGTNWGVVAAKRAGKNVRDGYVIMDLQTFKSMMEQLT